MLFQLALIYLLWSATAKALLTNSSKAKLSRTASPTSPICQPTMDGGSFGENDDDFYFSDSQYDKEYSISSDASTSGSGDREYEVKVQPEAVKSLPLKLRQTFAMPRLIFSSNDQRYRLWNTYLDDDYIICNPGQNKDGIDADRSKIRDVFDQATSLTEILNGISDILIKTIDPHPLAILNDDDDEDEAELNQQDLYNTILEPRVDWPHFQSLGRNTREAEAIKLLLVELCRRLDLRQPTSLWVIDDNLRNKISKIVTEAERPPEDVEKEHHKEKKKQQRNKSNRNATKRGTPTGAKGEKDQEREQHKSSPATAIQSTTTPEGGELTPRSEERVRANRTSARGETASTSQYAFSKVPCSAVSSTLIEPNLAEGRGTTVTQHNKSERTRAERSRAGRNRSTHLAGDLLIEREGGGVEEGRDEAGKGAGDSGDDVDLEGYFD
jgi:hypothetical protein